ncbi:carbohydrate sulfotransferase 1-like [Ptychodera flava]|uniref:carbohydrate sulfotransferase 1-like n=1 Tax=Ptychodera flava TaxID=63121 RepID=UPI00396A6F0A
MAAQKYVGVTILVAVVMITTPYYYSMWAKRSEKRFRVHPSGQNEPHPAPKSSKTQTGAATERNRVSIEASLNSETVTKDTSSKKADSIRSDSKTNLLIIGRMSSASSATGMLFSKRDDTFYVGEPGHMLCKTVFHKHTYIDSADYLEEMQPQLCQFLGDMFSCDFSSHGYYVDQLNLKGVHPGRRSFGNLNYPITTAVLSKFCQSKHNIIAKVLRFSDITPCLPTFQKYNVKFVFLARDPRGLITSRLRRWGPILANLNNEESDKYFPVAKIVKEHCAWLDKVFNLLKDGPKWFRENSMLVRFDDKCLFPGTIDQAIYDFVGIAAPSPSSPISQSHNESARNWLITHSYERMRELQDYCPEHIYNEFGWLVINNKKEFEKAKNSWYRPMPRDEIIPSYNLP